MNSVVEEFSELAFQLLANNDDTETKFLHFVEVAQKVSKAYTELKEVKLHLQNELLESKKEISSLQMKLNNAKELFDMEKNRRLYIEKHNYDLEAQINSLMDMLRQGKIIETKEKLQTLSSSFNIMDSHRLDPKDLLSPQNCLSTINEQYNSFALRKIPVIPRSAMKPLYWTRIQILSAVFENTPEDTVEEKINITAEPLWDNLTEEEFDESEFVDLFAKNVSAPVKAKKKIDEKITKAKVVKSLDSKRSQNIGIFITSQHLDIKDVENAVYNFDTTLLDLEILQQVYELRGTSEELNKIITQAVSSNDFRLDKPEQFLLDLSRINLFSERIFCFMFKATFAADLDVVHTRSNLLLTTIEKLMKSDSIKKILGLILAFGNYMNGGNRQRGQADGFGLEILPKLKDVKSKDSSITLLHFIVSKYIKKFEGADAGTDKVKLPIPDPYSVEKSSNVQFEELQKDLINLDTNLQVCERRSQQVIKDSDCDHLHPFQERMTEFIQEARKDLDRENLNLKECKKQFDKVKKYFQFNGKGKDVTPSEFFGVWAPFCNDFMQIWQKEQLKIVKTRIKEAEDAAKRIKEGKKEITLKGKEEGEDAGKHIKEGKKKITLKGTEEGGLKAKLKARMRH